ncbi:MULTISPECIES: zonular occludens toxin domain-containing protein [unclassified Coleofasciculus]|uniref:zonular occludens toxin domain-containing protein n=1 Tax=unclassified Coleofasciculus TaxID=2692782 RepID=UPI001882359E|nr:MULTISPECIES: zonular occludens toxin domain-containing protein [unclassified Coleofasciculus]MBE9124899.1 hypothetical protein [Coleofasciculus sp. LEGE 07081]MBE9147856.1 hypothetical protein [Coleofasciculus sp. LEGE 07092]
MVYIPPGTITGIVGEMGSGKTFVSLLVGFEIAEALKLDIITNFHLNAKALYYYFLYNGYTWLLSRLIHGYIQVRSCASGDKLLLSEFMREKKTLYIIDEAGAVYLNARNFKNIPLDFLASLAQVRHDSRRIFWIGQYKDQADKTIRELTSAYIFCDCPTKNSDKLGGNQELVGKFFRIFTARNFTVFERKVLGGQVTGFKAYASSLKLAEKTYQGNLTALDKLLFKCYSSFARVEENPCLVNPLKPWISYREVC